MCEELSGMFLDWNTPAIEFYEKTGAKVFKDWLVAQMDEKGLILLEKNKNTIILRNENI